MVKKIAAIIVIYIVCTIAWIILGSINYFRSEETGTKMRGKVESLWGSQQNQLQPDIHYTWIETVIEDEKVTDSKTGKEYFQKVTKNIEKSDLLSIQSTNINTDFKLEQRKKGLKWYSSYKVQFEGIYTFTAPAKNKEGKIICSFSFPSTSAIYDNFEFVILNDENQKASIKENEYQSANKTIEITAVPGKTYTLKLAYNSRGLDNWLYSFGNGVSEINNFNLTMTTDFEKIDFPDNTMSPDLKTRTANGWKLEWKFKSLVTGFKIGISMPTKLDPGPLASKVSFFAPICLLFFLVFIFFITIIKGINIHPIHYMFLSAAFFSFNLLFSYTVDHIDIYIAFAVSSIVSIFLVISYLRIVTGVKFALVEAGLSQLVYLVLFTFSFFFDGFTGLTVTIGSIVTLFVLMQLTAKIDWNTVFSKKTPI